MKGISSIYVAIIISFIVISLISSLIIFLYKFKEENQKTISLITNIIRGSGEEISFTKQGDIVNFCTNKKPYNISLAIMSNKTNVSVMEVNSPCFNLTQDQIINLGENNYSLVLITELGNYYFINLNQVSGDITNTNVNAVFVIDSYYYVLTGYKSPIVDDPQEDFIRPIDSLYDIYIYYTDDNEITLNVNDGTIIISKINQTALNLTAPSGSWPIVYLYVVGVLNVDNLSTTQLAVNITYIAKTLKSNVGYLRARVTTFLIPLDNFLEGVPSSPKWAAYEGYVLINSLQIPIHFIPYVVKDVKTIYWGSFPLDISGYEILNVTLLNSYSKYVVFMGLELTYSNNYGNILNIVFNVKDIYIKLSSTQ